MGVGNWRVRVRVRFRVRVRASVVRGPVFEDKQRNSSPKARLG